MSALRNFEIIEPENPVNTLGGKAAENSPDQSQGVREANAIRCWLQGKSEHTVRAYRRHLRDFLRIAGAENIAEACRDYSAGSAAIDALRAATENLAWRSRDQRYSALRKLLQLCERERVYREPLAHLLGSAGRTGEEALAAAASRVEVGWKDALRCIAREPHERNQLILRTLLNTGLRSFELAAARREHLRPCVTENGTETSELLVLGKGRKARWVTLRPELAAQIHGYLVLTAPAGYTTIFGVGDRHVQRVCRDAWGRIGVSGGPKGAAAHLFRHIFAASAIRAAENRAVTENLGHASPRTTEIYTTELVPDPPTAHLPYV